MRAIDLAIILIQYVIRVDSTDLSGFDVEMHLKDAPPAFEIAMNAHPEYDDRYWRYLRNMRIEGARPGATVVRSDSAVWRVTLPGGEGTVRYRIVLPTPAESPRAAWRPFLSPTGALMGGPHAFLYLPGHENAGARVTVQVPASWEVISSLPMDGSDRSFRARDVAELVEAPIFAGHYSKWGYVVNGVPHRVIYWHAPGAASFDSVAFVRGLELVTQGAARLFGAIPWSEYTFIFQDSAYGGLEHATSVTLGAPSAELAQDPQSNLPEAAHEFFHAWNLMRIRPIEYRTVDYRPQPPSAGLWFSEGLTIFYADLLMRRAGLPLNDTTRIAHIGHILSRYLSLPGNTVLSAERVSRAAYANDPTALGDYSASTHLQGEVLGAMLDFIIRDATDGARSIDDVMRLMHQRYPPGHGYTSVDVEQIVAEVCGCDVTPFFDSTCGRRHCGLSALSRRDGLTATVRDSMAMRTAPRQRMWAWAWNRPVGWYAPGSPGTARQQLWSRRPAWETD
jgi:predicted metalloprotease with PDZ domain